MPEDILAKTAPPRPIQKPKGLKISILGTILVLFLAVVLILLGERFIFDLNRWTNPLAQQSSTDSRSYSISSLSMERSVLAPGIGVYYPAKEKGKYLGYKLLIHASFVLPVFLLIFLLYYLVEIKEQKEGWRVVIYAYMVFAFWMMLHLLSETIKYISYQYRSIAIYIVLLLLVAILTPLAVFLQKKHSERTI